ncbi:MAG: hypothetical protein AAGI52_15655 [Bacteroidota bacterium]
MPLVRFALTALVVILAGCAGSRPSAPLLLSQTSGTDALLISAYAVDEDVVWLAGTGGTVVRTLDGGDTWTPMTVPGADSLQFRDVHAWSADDALVLSIGNGTDSRIYRTEDGGATWAQTWVNDIPDAFYDCLDFWDENRGLAFSDAVDGVFPFIQTSDGGRTWTRLPEDNPPAAQDGEGSFASSGTCLVTTGDATAWQATGNAETPRLLATTDRGATWTSTDLPLAGGEAAGGATVALGPDGRAVIAGGDIAKPNEFAPSVAVTSDGGETWQPGGQLPFTGALYGAAFVSGTESVIGVGPGGVALSRDGGETWTLLSAETHWGIAAVEGGAWLVGPEGRVTRVLM